MLQLIIISFTLLSCMPLTAVNFLKRYQTSPASKVQKISINPQKVILTTVPKGLCTVATLAFLYRDLNHAIRQFNSEEYPSNSVYEYYAENSEEKSVHQKISDHITSVKKKIKYIKKTLTSAEREIAKKIGHS
jgi:hypothetical protein